MGVFHLAGLGLNPGAVTVPLTYIYFLLRQSQDNDGKAQEFFALSGEQGKSDEVLRGQPEALIVFTSKEVIKGEKQNDINDNLFRTQKGKSACDTMRKYLANLVRRLRLNQYTYSECGVKYFYAVCVDINNFEDCYKKIYLTMQGLKEKEVWCNLIGGSNQINLSLMLAGAMSGIPTRFYYVFETEIKTLHPTSIESVSQKIEVPPPNWHEIPPLFISLGEVIRKLVDIGLLQGSVHENVLKKALSEYMGARQFFAKLRGTWIVKDAEASGMWKAGPLLESTVERNNKLDEIVKEKVTNFSAWKEYFIEQGYIKAYIEDGQCQVRS